ncbi:MAG: glycosyltransferase family 39 protein [Lentisphaerae bacterium]|nr:glycosyltransferase family 39 protein [Lentisphaerota bacterium]
MAQTATRSRQRFLLALGGLSLLALALRVVVCIELCPLPSVAEPAVVTDMATYRRLGLEIARGQFPTHFYYQPFYYAVFLPIVYTLTGDGPWGPALIQAILGAATVWLTGLTAAQLFGRRAGLLAAALLAVARFQVFYVPFLLIEVLQGFWLSLLTWLALRFWHRRDARHLVAIGLTAAAAVLTRGNALLLVPGLLALIAWRLRDRPARAVAAAAVCLALVYLPQFPFALRNWQHFGRWTGPSSAQDAVLALGNTPEAPPGGLEYPASYHDWTQLAGRSGPERVPVSRQALAWIRAEPLVWLELKARMALLYWHHLEIPNNISIDREGRHSALLRGPWLLPYAPIGILALVGLMVSWRWRSPGRLFLYYAILTHWAATVLFYILARFRLSGVPWFCIAAGAGLTAAGGLIRPPPNLPPDGRRRRLGLGILAALAAVFIVGLPLGPRSPVTGAFSWYQRLLEAPIQRWIRPDGVRVHTPQRLLVYDRGPYALGGLAAVPVPMTGLAIQKRLVLPPGDLPNTPPKLRVPVRLTSGTRFEALLRAAGKTYGGRDMRVEEEPGRQWLTFTLDGLPDGARPEEILLELKLLQGEMGVLVDTLRWYDRSRYANDTGTLPIQAEAAFELEWRLDTATP